MAFQVLPRAFLTTELCSSGQAGLLGKKSSLGSRGVTISPSAREHTRGAPPRHHLGLSKRSELPVHLLYPPCHSQIFIQDLRPQAEGVRELGWLKETQQPGGLDASGSRATWIPCWRLTPPLFRSVPALSAHCFSGHTCLRLGGRTRDRKGNREGLGSPAGQRNRTRPAPLTPAALAPPAPWLPHRRAVHGADADARSVWRGGKRPRSRVALN